MSDGTDVFFAPKATRALTPERLEALVCELILKGIVSAPCAVLEGDIPPDRRWELIGVADRGKKVEGMRRLYGGRASSRLRAALRRAALGERDVCVWFEGIDWEHEIVRASFEREGLCSGDLLLFALARPIEQRLRERGKRTPLHHFAVLCSQPSTENHERTALGAVLARHLGPLRAQGDERLT